MITNGITWSIFKNNMIRMKNEKSIKYDLKKFFAFITSPVIKKIKSKINIISHLQFRTKIGDSKKGPR